MRSLPGQRIIIMMSPGFFVTPSLRESGDIIDRATKANIVINSIDARGLYVSAVYDAANSSLGSAARIAFVRTEETIQDDILAELPDGTGGTFFHNRNDIDQGLLEAAQEPEVSYLLGFTPQNLKFDGKYHHLKVTFTSLSPAKKADLLDAVWESLEADAASLTDAQRTELDSRIERHEKNPFDVMPWEQVRAGLFTKS